MVTVNINVTYKEFFILYFAASMRSKIVKRLRCRQYDPAIIEKTIRLVLGHFTTLYRSFLKRCTLTNKAVGTI